MADLLTRTRTMLTPDWLPSQPRLAKPSPGDPTTRKEAEALLRRLPHRQQVLCAYLAAMDALPVWIASGETSTAPQDALALVRRWLAGGTVSGEWEAAARGSAAAAAAAGAASAAASAAAWAAWAAWALNPNVTSKDAQAAYLPLWWRRSRAALAFRDAATAEITWETDDE